MERERPCVDLLYQKMLKALSQAFYQDWNLMFPEEQQEAEPAMPNRRKKPPVSSFTPSYLPISHQTFKSDILSKGGAFLLCKQPSTWLLQRHVCTKFSLFPHQDKSMSNMSKEFVDILTLKSMPFAYKTATHLAFETNARKSFKRQYDVAQLALKGL